MKVPVAYPTGAELLVTAGQRVDFTTPFYKKKGVSTINIPVAENLKFSPDRIFLALKKVVGDQIKKGDLLAENKSFLSTKQFVSSVNGLIKEIDHITGSLLVELENGENKLEYCFFTGEIAAIHEDHLELKVEKAIHHDIQHTNHYFGASVYYADDPEKPFTEDKICDKCIVGEHINPIELPKIDTLGAKAILTDRQLPPHNAVTQLFLRNEGDFKEILKLQYPYCLTDLDCNTIYFYE